MTQTDVYPPYTGQYQEYREELQVIGEQLATTVEQLIHEGNVRRIIIKHEGQTILEIPLTIGVVGVLLAPILAALGAIGAAVTNCTIEVVRTDRPEQPDEADSMQKVIRSALSEGSAETYSIAYSGMRLFEQSPITTLMGETMIDLVSAPIEPGEYRLEINVTMGHVEIFLPRYVQFTMEGSSILGGRNVHERPGIWETMRQKLPYLVGLSNQPPDFALALYNPDRPIHIHFVIHVTMGSVDIYRL